MTDTEYRRLQKYLAMAYLQAEEEQAPQTRELIAEAMVVLKPRPLRANRERDEWE